MELTGYKQQIKSKVNHVYVTKDGFWQKKGNSQEERTQRTRAWQWVGGGGSRGRRGLSLGGRAGRVSGDTSEGQVRGAEVAVRLVCVGGGGSWAQRAEGHAENLQAPRSRAFPLPACADEFGVFTQEVR